MVKLNETPIRTCRNFNINNIKLENVIVPEKLESFENVNIDVESSKDVVKSEQNDIKLKYGIGLDRPKSNCGLKIEINSKMKNAIVINFKFDEKNHNLIENILVDAKANTKSNIIIKYSSDEDLEYFHNGILKINACENSEVNVIYVNLLNTKSNNFISIENEILDNAKVKFCIVDFGGKNSISNYYSNIMRKECR